MAPQSKVLPRASAGWTTTRRIIMSLVTSVYLAWRRVGCRSEIVQQPDHYPWLVEQAVDVAEESVDQGLHGRFLLVVAARTRKIGVLCCSKFSDG